MVLNLIQLLELKEETDGSGNTHFYDGPTIVASVFVNINTRIDAKLGDDENVIPFSFNYSGPVAVVYSSAETIEALEGRQPVLCVMAIMSAVTFADISMWIGLDDVYIRPSTVMQFDIGVPELYELAKGLICHHTGKMWEEDFLAQQYAAQNNAILELHSKITNWTA